MEASVGLCWDRAVVGGGLDRVITQIFANPGFQSPQVLVPLGELEALRTSRSRTPCIVSVADILQISCLLTLKKPSGPLENIYILLNYTKVTDSCCKIMQIKQKRIQENPLPRAKSVVS